MSAAKRRAFVVAAGAFALGACSLVTSFEGLPLGPLDGGVDGADDGGADAATDAPPRDLCTVGAYYCGGDRVVGDPSTLHRCLPDGGAAVAIACAHGCARRPDGGDACVCVVGTPYCGNDQIVGDPGSLYQCESDYSGKLLRACDAGCVVQAGKNDACR